MFGAIVAVVSIVGLGIGLVLAPRLTAWDDGRARSAEQGAEPGVARGAEQGAEQGAYDGGGGDAVDGVAGDGRGGGEDD